MAALWKVRLDDGAVRWARGPVEDGPVELVEPDLDGLLSSGDLAEVRGSGPVPSGAQVLAPVGGQEVWAAGVTYRRSRQARMEESRTPDHYDRVYEADRPELFFKSAGWRVRGPGEPIGVRRDSTWDVPEPELGLVVGREGAIVAYVIGNDVSSRSIEGENPLYLPQAKIYIGSCALGPCLVPIDEAPHLSEMVVSLRIVRGGAPAFEGSVGVDQLKREPSELVGWLVEALDFPVGVVLLTGTGVVPDRDFALEVGDEVVVSITGLGELRNPVERVGAR